MRKASLTDQDRRREPRFQSGVLRTNCIDCLDRTNVAQYAYGLAALGCQLHAVGLSDDKKLDPEGSVAAALMSMYHNMGDVIAIQYGGSAAHNTVSIIALKDVECLTRVVAFWYDNVYAVVSFCFTIRAYM